MKLKVKNLLKYLRYFIGIFLIILLFKKIDLTEIRFDEHGGLHILFYGVGLIIIACLIVQYSRFYLFVRHPLISLNDSLKLFLIGYFFNNLLPSNIGGDTVRAYYIHRHTDESISLAISKLFLFRLTGMLPLIMFGLIYSLFNFREVSMVFTKVEVPTVFWLFLILLLCSIFLLYVFLKKNKKTIDSLKIFIGGLKECQRKTLIYGFILGLLFHIFRAWGLCLIARFFGVELQLTNCLFALFASAVISLIPISVGGIGVTEGVLTFLFVNFGIPAPIGLSLALIQRTVLLLIGIMGAGVFFFTKGFTLPRHQKT